MTLPVPGQLGFGAPPHDDPLVDLARRISDLEARLANLQGSIATSLQFQSLASDVNSASFTHDGTYYTLTSLSVTVPAGMTRMTWNLFGSVGSTFTGSGSLGAQISINGQVGPATGNATPSAGACSTAAGFGGTGTVTPGASVSVAVKGAFSGASTAGSDDAHLSGTITWSRT